MTKKRNVEHKKSLDGSNKQKIISDGVSKIMTTIRTDNIVFKKQNKRRRNRNKSKKLDADTSSKSDNSVSTNKKQDTKDFRNISFKASAGCNNWKKFLEVEATKKTTTGMGEAENKVETNPTLKSHKKKLLPLLKYTNNSNGNNSVNGINRWPKSDKVKPRARITKCVAMDCEMVGIGEKGSISIIARVSIVNAFGDCIYDKFVKPTDTVTDYRTFVSGIRPRDLEKGEDFHTVQAEVANILKDRTLIGHSLKNDLDVLMLCHPRRYTRDTLTFMKFRGSRGAMSLKMLAEKFINAKIQDGEHSSVEDARAAMQLYMTYRKEWENERRERFSKLRGTKPVSDKMVAPKQLSKERGFSEIAT